jgi:hypothetical protein
MVLYIFLSELFIVLPKQIPNSRGERRYPKQAENDVAGSGTAREILK